MSIKAFAASQGDEIVVIPISFLNPCPPNLLHLCITIDPRNKIDPNRPGLLVMTSGTTGPSKGVIHARKFFTHALRYLTSNDVFLHHRPAAWMGGLVPLITGMCRGVQLELVKPDASIIWERLRIGRVTVLRSVPPVWGLLMNYYKETISKMAPQKIEEYMSGLRNLRVVIASSGYLQHHVRKFWAEEMNLPMSITYAGTEMGGPVTSRSSFNLSDDEVCKFHILASNCFSFLIFQQRRIGNPWPNVTVKLSEGDHGEILVKSPTMFLGYHLILAK